MTTEQLANIYFEKKQEVKDQKEMIGNIRLKIQQAIDNGKFNETSELQKQLKKDLNDQTILHDELLRQEGNIGMDLIQKFQDEGIPFNSEKRYWLSENRYFSVVVKSENSLIVNGPLSQL